VDTYNIQNEASEVKRQETND